MNIKSVLQENHLKIRKSSQKDSVICCQRIWFFGNDNYVSFKRLLNSLHVM